MPEYVITLSVDWRVKEGHAVSWLSVYSICLAWFLAYIARSFRDFTLEALKETVIYSKIRRELIRQRKIKSSSVNKMCSLELFTRTANSWKSPALKSSASSQVFVCFSHEPAVLCSLVGGGANQNLRGGSPAITIGLAISYAVLFVSLSRL